MSRKWERMIEKNKKQVNQHRKKSGKGEISTDGHPEMDVYRGRSIFLPLFFLSISILFLLFFGSIEEKDALYWVTVICYAVLAFYFFFMKRPYLKVGKAEIVTRKLGRDKAIKAADLEKITIQRGYVIINVKGKRSQMIFSKFFNRYDLKAMSKGLETFAGHHSIPYIDEN